MGIAVFGAVFVDVKGYPDPGFNPKGRNSGRVRTVHGGVARNVAEDLANVELRPVFVSLVDDTGMGEDVIKELDKHKADTRYIRRVPDGMGTWLAIFDNTGDVAASVSKRPDLKEIGTILDECGDEIIGNCDSAVVEIDMDASIVKKIFALAKKYGKTVYGVVSNMNIAVERRDFLKNLGCFVCNRQEAGLRERHAGGDGSTAAGADPRGGNPGDGCDTRPGRRGLCFRGGRARFLGAASRGSEGYDRCRRFVFRGRCCGTYLR